MLKCTKFDFRPLAGFKGPTSKGKEGEGREGKEGWEGNGEGRGGKRRKEERKGERERNKNLPPLDRSGYGPEPDF